MTDRQHALLTKALSPRFAAGALLAVAAVSLWALPLAAACLAVAAYLAVNWILNMSTVSFILFSEDARPIAAGAKWGHTVHHFWLWFFILTFPHVLRLGFWSMINAMTKR